jgi:Stress responsive A/B Barrel Domain
MRFQILYSALMLAAFVGCTTTTPNPAPAAANPAAPLLRHVVMFKFKAGTTPEQVREIEQAFAALKTQLPNLIKDFEFGTNNSPEGLDQGLTHCFLVTFASEKDRDAYIPHPIHQAFVDRYAKVFVDKVTVVDYWAK